MGEDVLLRATIVNNGPVVANQVRAVIAYPAQLQLKQATQGADQSLVQQRQVAWNLLQLKPGQQVVVEGVFQAVFPVNQVESVLQVNADFGDPATAKQLMTIRPSGAGANGDGSVGTGVNLGSSNLSNGVGAGTIESSGADANPNAGPSLPLQGNPTPADSSSTGNVVPNTPSPTGSSTAQESASGTLQVPCLVATIRLQLDHPFGIDCGSLTTHLSVMGI